MAPEKGSGGGFLAEVGESAFPMLLALHVFDEMAMPMFGG